MLGRQRLRPCFNWVDKTVVVRAVRKKDAWCRIESYTDQIRRPGIALEFADNEQLDPNDFANWVFKSIYQNQRRVVPKTRTDNFPGRREAERGGAVYQFFNLSMAEHRGSIQASHPAPLCSIHNSPKILQKTYKAQYYDEIVRCC